MYQPVQRNGIGYDMCPGSCVNIHIFTTMGAFCLDQLDQPYTSGVCSWAQHNIHNIFPFSSPKGIFCIGQ